MSNYIHSVRLALAATLAVVLGFTVHSLFCFINPNLFLKFHLDFLYLVNIDKLEVNFSWSQFIWNALFLSIAVFVFIWIFAQLYNFLSRES